MKKERCGKQRALTLGATEEYQQKKICLEQISLLSPKINIFIHVQRLNRKEKNFTCLMFISGLGSLPYLFVMRKTADTPCHAVCHALISMLEILWLLIRLFGFFFIKSLFFAPKFIKSTLIILFPASVFRARSPCCLFFLQPRTQFLLLLSVWCCSNGKFAFDIKDTWARSKRKRQIFFTKRHTFQCNCMSVAVMDLLMPCYINLFNFFCLPT